MPKFNELKPYKLKMFKKITAYITLSALAASSVVLYAKKMKIFKTVSREQEREQ